MSKAFKIDLYGYRDLHPLLVVGNLLKINNLNHKLIFLDSIRKGEIELIGVQQEANYYIYLDQNTQALKRRKKEMKIGNKRILNWNKSSRCNTLCSSFH